jgi:hypothetical protein
MKPAVAEVLILFRAAQVLEIEHRHRLLCLRSDLRSSGRHGASGIDLLFQPLQVRPQVGSGLLTCLGVLLQRLADDPVEFRWDLRIEPGCGRRDAMEDGLEDSRRRVAAESLTARRYLEGHHAEAEQIGPRIKVQPSRVEHTSRSLRCVRPGCKAQTPGGP